MAKVIVVVDDSGEALGVFKHATVMEDWAESMGYESSDEEDYVLVPKADSENIGNLSISYSIEYIE